MEIKDLMREKVLTEMLNERDTIIIQLFQRVQELERQINELKKEEKEK